MSRFVPWYLNVQTQIPTALLYDSEGRVVAWGLEAKHSGPLPGVVKCEWCSFPNGSMVKTYNMCLQGLSFSLNPWPCEIAMPLIPAFPAFQCVITSRLNVAYLIGSQAGKQAIDLIADFLFVLWEYAQEQIPREIGSVVDLSACPTLKVGRRSHRCVCDRFYGCMAYCTRCMGREGLEHDALSGIHCRLGTSSHGGRQQLEGPPAHNYVRCFLPD